MRLDERARPAHVPKHFRGGERPPDSSAAMPRRRFRARGGEARRDLHDAGRAPQPDGAARRRSRAWHGDTLTLRRDAGRVRRRATRLAKRFGLPAGEGARRSTASSAAASAPRARRGRTSTLAAMAARMVAAAGEAGADAAADVHLQRLPLARPSSASRLGAQHDGRLVAVMHDGIVADARRSASSSSRAGSRREMHVSSPEPRRHASGRARSMAARRPSCARRARRPACSRSNPRWTSWPMRAAASTRSSCACGTTPSATSTQNLPWSSKSLRQCYEQGARALRLEAARSAAAARCATATCSSAWGMASATYPANRSPAGATVRIRRRRQRDSGRAARRTSAPARTRS